MANGETTHPAATTRIVGLVIPAFILGLSLQFNESVPGALHLFGGLMELCGLGTIAYGLNELLDQFGRAPGPFTQLIRRTKAWTGRTFRKLTGREPRSVVLNVHGASMGVSSDSVRLRVWPGRSESADLEQRLVTLERQVTTLKTWHDEAALEIAEHVRKLRESIQEGNRKRAEADEQTQEMVRQLATGGVRIEALGLIWLLLGIVAQTIGPYIG